MRIVVCPDSFKGSLTSVEASAAMADGARAAAPDADMVQVPLADGGEGTVDALVQAAKGEIRRITVCDPLMRPVMAAIGVLDGGATAVIEMASASGLPLLSDAERDPMVTSTYGTGQLILSAVEMGANRIILGIGGSATNDGGAGAMSALGAAFLDGDGNPLPSGGAALARLARIDMSGFRFPTDRVRVEVACDVSNPLCGPTGASAVFGPQKGATPAMVVELDRALGVYAEVVSRDLGRDVAGMPGAGAAGGFGAGLAAFLNAELRSGIDMVLDAVGFDSILQGADMVITGEGRIDEQTAFGKTIAGVLKRAQRVGVPVVAIGGSVGDELSPLYELGLRSAFSITRGPTTLAVAMSDAARLLRLATEGIVRLVR